MHASEQVHLSDDDVNDGVDAGVQVGGLQPPTLAPHSRVQAVVPLHRGSPCRLGRLHQALSRFFIRCRLGTIRITAWTSATGAKAFMILYMLLQLLKHGSCAMQAQRSTLDDACAVCAFGLGACMCSAAHGSTNGERTRFGRREIGFWDHLIWL
mmetsp:Transcript_25471/g.59301  ORF Transcript_25471/g.59301 Transcript_25471/m.59301 type:complete len:154 (-) Transcript_25471:272-733(-)